MKKTKKALKVTKAVALLIMACLVMLCSTSRTHASDYTLSDMQLANIEEYKQYITPEIENSLIAAAREFIGNTDVEITIDQTSIFFPTLEDNYIELYAYFPDENGEDTWLDTYYTVDAQTWEIYYLDDTYGGSNTDADLQAGWEYESQIADELTGGYVSFLCEGDADMTYDYIKIHVTEPTTQLEYDVYISKKEGSSSDFYVGSRSLGQGFYTIDSIEPYGGIDNGYTYTYKPDIEGEFEVKKELVTNITLYYEKAVVESTAWTIEGKEESVISTETTEETPATTTPIMPIIIAAIVGVVAGTALYFFNNKKKNEKKEEKKEDKKDE